MRIPLVFCFLALMACSAPLSLEINGDPRPVDEVNSTIEALPTGETVLRVSVFSDPIPEAIDDELSIDLFLAIDDLNDLVLGAPIFLGQNITGSFLYGCFCFGEGVEPAAVSGSVLFTFISPEALSGELDVTLTGADPNGIDLGTVTLKGRFNAEL